MFVSQDAARVALATVSNAKHDAAFRDLNARLIDASFEDESGMDSPSGLCVIDLRRNGDPVLAGWNLDTNLQIASMAKVAALFAACQLRDDLIALRTSSGRMQARAVLESLKRAWGRSPSAVCSALGRMPDTVLPEIGRIFDLSVFERQVAMLPDFTSQDPMELLSGSYSTPHYRRVQSLYDAIPVIPASPDPPKPPSNAARDAEYKKKKADYDAAVVRLVQWYDEVAPKVSFDDLLLLMTMWSSNEAASVCISLLGLPYIKAALLQSGLYDDQRKQGLWLGGEFRPLFSARRFRAIGSDARPVSAYKEKTSTQVGTARRCALLFASLARDQLFKSSNAQMRLLLKYPRPLGQPGAFVPPSHPTFDDSFNRDAGLTLLLDKIGVLGDVHCESAYILYRQHAFAIAALGTTQDTLDTIGSQTLSIIQRVSK